MGHFNNGARVLSLLYNKVNFSLTQRILQQIQHLDFLHERLLWLSGICGCADMWAHQQVNVATFFGIIHARTKKPHRCALAECSGCGLANGLNLVGVETHALIVCSAGEGAYATRKKLHEQSKSHEMFELLAFFLEKSSCYQQQL